MKVTAKVQRADDWWAVEVPEVPGVFTQVKRLDQVAGMVSDAVATMLDIDADDVEVTLDPVFNVALVEHVTDALRLAKEAAAAQEAASRAMRATVLELREEEKLSVRDVAVLLGVSHQRVSQLVDSAR